jgi:hypothetical protein
MHRRPIASSVYKCSGYCVGLARRKFVTTTSASAAAIRGIAAVSSAARAAAHSAAASPIFGDPDKQDLAQDARDAAFGVGASSAAAPRSLLLTEFGRQYNGELWLASVTRQLCAFHAAPMVPRSVPLFQAS